MSSFSLLVRPDGTFTITDWPETAPARRVARFTAVGNHRFHYVESDCGSIFMWSDEGAMIPENEQLNMGASLVMSKHADTSMINGRALFTGAPDESGYPAGLSEEAVLGLVDTLLRAYPFAVRREPRIPRQRRK
ncbi:hypothetical protein [Streptomyces sp. NPDC088557]|uniref:hypothetical protein n=1 Tax=Streptomyces sp. NPDC088557 TaxID=3365867 RepID=UPI0037F70653